MFGSMVGGTVSNIGVRPHFAGHEHIEEFELIHMNGRVYDPTVGRFLSSDPNIPHPFMSQSFNRYSYVMNNPLKYTDPSGFRDDYGGDGGWDSPNEGIGSINSPENTSGGNAMGDGHISDGGWDNSSGGWDNNSDDTARTEITDYGVEAHISVTFTAYADDKRDLDKNNLDAYDTDFSGEGDNSNSSSINKDLSKDVDNSKFGELKTATSQSVALGFFNSVIDFFGRVATIAKKNKVAMNALGKVTGVYGKIMDALNIVEAEDTYARARAAVGIIGGIVGATIGTGATPGPGTVVGGIIGANIGREFFSRAFDNLDREQKGAINTW